MMLDRVATLGRLSGDVLSIATFGRMVDHIPLVTGELRSRQGPQQATESTARLSSTGGGGRLGSESNSQIS